MSATTATAHGHAHTEHHELGFVRTYIFSTDHKMIARQFLFMGLFMMILGGLLALVVRWELAWPETAVPRSEEHTSELQSRSDLVCRLLLEKKKKKKSIKMRDLTIEYDR